MEHLTLLGKLNRKMNFIRGMKNKENARIMTDLKKKNNFFDCLLVKLYVHTFF